jgi:type I restriction enzyme R subunit
MSPTPRPASLNFGFMAAHDEQFVRLATLAERNFLDDPPTALVKLRQFGELLAKLIAARNAITLDPRVTFEGTLTRLREGRALPREAADAFHDLRRLGNAAAHENSGTHAQALTALSIFQSG